jgi:C4-dicarboxylate-binding protein DctP
MTSPGEPVARMSFTGRRLNAALHPVGTSRKLWGQIRRMLVGDAELPPAGLHEKLFRAVNVKLRKLQLTLNTCCLVLLALCVAGALSAHAQTVTLRLSLPISRDSTIGRNIGDFAHEAEERTGGAIRIEFEGKNRNYEENEVVSAVASGAVEMGAAPLNQFAYDVPLAGVFLQPFLFNFDALVQAATKRGSEIRTLIEEDVLYWTNAHVLWWQPYGSGVIFSKKIPATNPEAIAGRAVGTPDDQMKELVRICGANPYLVSPSTLFDEMGKDTIQMAAADIMSVKERALWQVADTITNLRSAPSLYLVVINGKAWASLTREHQAILSELAQAAQDRMWQHFAAVKAEAFTFAAQKGMSIVELRREDIAAWRACSAPLLEAYMERVGETGPKLFTAYGKLRTDSCCRGEPEEAPLDRR